MIEIKNLRFQPLCFSGTGGKSLHLGARETVQVPDTELTAEIELAAGRGFVALKRVEKPPPTHEKPKPPPRTRKKTRRK